MENFFVEKFSIAVKNRNFKPFIRPFIFPKITLFSHKKVTFPIRRTMILKTSLIRHFSKIFPVRQISCYSGVRITHPARIDGHIFPIIFLLNFGELSSNLKPPNSWFAQLYVPHCRRKSLYIKDILAPHS